MSAMTLDSNNKLPLAVIGSSSMVGSRFCDLSNQNFRLIKADLHGEIPVDITDVKSVRHFFLQNNFQYLILFSAFADVDEAEKQRGNKEGNCWKINVEGVRNVANACKKFKRKLIFISTDFVFDGINGPYDETDPIGGDLDKISWYGLSKIEGEKIVQRVLADFIILRISYPYRAEFQKKDDFAKIILRRYQENNLFPMFSDQFYSPTFIDDLAPATRLIISRDQRGIFHIASPQITTPYDFAKHLILAFGGNPSKVRNGSILQTKLGAPRSANGGLKVEKIRNLGFLPTDWKRGIQIIYSQSKGKLI